MCYVAYILGILIFINALMSSASAETSIHQIYFQLQYISAAVLFSAGVVADSVNSFRRLYKKELKKNEEKKKVEELKEGSNG